MPTTPPPDAIEHLIQAARLTRAAFADLPDKEAERRFAELAKLYFSTDTDRLRAL